MSITFIIVSLLSRPENIVGWRVQLLQITTMKYCYTCMSEVSARTKYCSSSCRQKAYRLRRAKRLQKLARESEYELLNAEYELVISWLKHHRYDMCFIPSFDVFVFAKALNRSMKSFEDFSMTVYDIAHELREFRINSPYHKPFQKFLELRIEKEC